IDQYSMETTTEVPVHYRYNGQLYCPAVGHAVVELKINHNEGQYEGQFTGFNVVENNATSELTNDRNSIFSPFSSHDSPQQISPNSKTRAFLEEFNMLISRNMNNDLALSSDVLQSFSNFQRTYESLKGQKNDRIEIIEISDDEDELQGPVAAQYNREHSMHLRSMTLIRPKVVIKNIMPLPGVKIDHYPTLPKFKNLHLKKAALTHHTVNSTVGCNYERLEHLGDRVLQHVANQMAFDRAEKHPVLCKFEEQIMKKIEVAINFFVNNKTLAVVGHILDVKTYAIKEAGGPKRFTTKDTADYVEALIGALYEDNYRDFDPIREWYEPITGSLLDRILYATAFGGPDEWDVFNWASDMYSHLNKRFIRPAQ
ncbi:13477_t:CDS:2, partial [Ambispora gerdemannii]